MSACQRWDRNLSHQYHHTRTLTNRPPSPHCYYYYYTSIIHLSIYLYLCICMHNFPESSFRLPLPSTFLKYTYLQSIIYFFIFHHHGTFTIAGPFRGRMKECYHSYCDGPIGSGVADLGFLKKVTQAVVWTVADLAMARCGPRGQLRTSTLFALLGKPNVSSKGKRVGGKKLTLLLS